MELLTLLLCNKPSCCVLLLFKPPNRDFWLSLEWLRLYRLGPKAEFNELEDGLNVLEFRCFNPPSADPDLDFVALSSDLAID